jgi:ribonuclease PH
MTFRTTLQDIDVEVCYNKQGEMVDVRLLSSEGGIMEDVLPSLRKMHPKHIDTLAEETDEHFQMEEWRNE